MSQSDYEDDVKRKLSITDPYGVNTKINADTVFPCPACGSYCVRSGEGCKGQVNMMSDMHLCDEHKKEKHGAPNNWYESEETSKDGLVERELGMQGDNTKKLDNWGGTYKDKQDVGEDYSKEDPRYVNG